MELTVIVVSKVKKGTKGEIALILEFSSARRLEFTMRLKYNLRFSEEVIARFLLINFLVNFINYY